MFQDGTDGIQVDTKVSIPQAVSTIAIREKGLVFKPIGLVSIPQAVSTIAIVTIMSLLRIVMAGFNTASGKYYCNVMTDRPSFVPNTFQYRKR